MNYSILNNGFVEDNLKTEDGKNILIEFDVNDDITQSFSFNNSFHDSMENIRKQESILNFENRDHFAGAPMANIKLKRKSPQAEEKELVVVKKNGFMDLQNIAKELLMIIIDKYPYIYQSGSINDSKIIEYIYPILKEKGYSINNSEYEIIIRYLRDHFFSAIKHKYIQKHSLMSLINYGGIYDVFLKQHQEFDDGILKQFDHNRKVTIVKAISEFWTDISSLLEYNNYVDFYKYPIDPLFFLLFSVKLPGFEDVCIKQDYFQMAEQLKDENLHKDNIFLTFLRILDLNALPSKNPQHHSQINNELLRGSINNYLKHLCYCVRTGTFVSKVSDQLLELLNDIKMPNCHFEEENLIHAILATFSFKPTLVSSVKYNTSLGSNLAASNAMMNGLPIVNSQILNTPKAVYTMNLPILDHYSLTQLNIERPTLSSNNFTSIGFDPQTNKVLFLYNDQRRPLDNDVLLQKIYNLLSTQKLETDLTNVFSTVTGNMDQLISIYKNITPVKLLLSNGMFIVSVPRAKYENYCNPESNFFYRSTFEKTISLINIDISHTINANNISYNLIGALCYDILEHEKMGNIIYSTSVENKYKIGTMAIVKIGDHWINYNPNECLTSERKRTKINLMQRKAFETFDELNPNEGLTLDERFKEFLKNPIAEDIKKNILANKVRLNDMIISEEHAKHLINTRACLIFYAESYETFKSRINNKFI